jgi:hypothetical protein
MDRAAGVWGGVEDSPPARDRGLHDDWSGLHRRAGPVGGKSRVQSHMGSPASIQTGDVHRALQGQYRAPPGVVRIRVTLGGLVDAAAADR